jgi:hypothetical protein
MTNEITKQKELENIKRTALDEMIPFWAIVARAQRVLQLSETTDLVSFVRYAIEGLVDAGAKPAVFAGTGQGLMRAVTRYGHSPQEVADAVIAEWAASGYATPESPGDLWFASAEVCTTELTKPEKKNRHP